MLPAHLNIRLVSEADIPQIRVLVNQAYKELADMGLNYTATYQDEEITRSRVSKGRAPDHKKQGLRLLLMDYCEELTKREKFEAVQLDTAKPANHLVRWYQSRGNKIVGEDHYEGKNI